jgi:soluble lytic murein transglycosylase
MMTRTLALSLSLCLGSALSCSPDRPASGPGTTPAAASAELEAIETQLARMQTGLNREELRATAEVIAEEAAHNQLDVELILAVIHTESAFHNFARSHVGALGLMQVMPATGEMLARQHGLDWAGPETLFDPVANVRLGCRYLAALRARYGRIDAALAAYNWGPGAIDERLARGESLPRKYPTLVLARLESQSATSLTR